MLALAATLASATPGPAQERAAVIDTVVLERSNVFPGDSAAGWQRTMNALHVVTRPGAIRRDLLLDVGDPYDAGLAEETARNLRGRRIFADVSVDSARLPDGRLALLVRTVDAWTTSPKISYSVAGDGTTTSIFGITESNLLGSGGRVQLWRRKDVDRSGLDVAASFQNVFGTAMNIDVAYANLSDQTIGSWSLGTPFETLSQVSSIFYEGEAFDGRIFRYRTTRPEVVDTTAFFRRAFINRLTVGLAPRANTDGYVRVGGIAEVRREEILRMEDPDGLVPDTIYGAFGAFVELRGAKFDTVRYFNAFSEEDRDLSRVLRFTAMVAPGGWGYERWGFGPRVEAKIGSRLGSGFLRASLEAGTLVTSSGADSSRIVIEASGGLKPSRRHATLLKVGVGLLENPAPGGEFDYGFQTPPRLWDPHAFTGDRSARVSLEHRWYAWDSVLDLVGIGFGGFVDAAGAWFDDQDARGGGSAGLTVLLGSSLAAVPATGTFSVGWRLGSQAVGDRFAASFVAGLVF